IADRHVLDHATAQRADTFSPHSEGSCLFVVDSQTQPDRQAASLYKPSATLSTGITIAISGHYRASGSVQSTNCVADRQKPSGKNIESLEMTQRAFRETIARAPIHALGVPDRVVNRWRPK